MQSDITSLHQLYCELTGFELRLTMDRERDWFEWCRCGFTADDLRLAVKFLKRGIKDGQRNPGALKFSNLIGQPDMFEEDLSMFKALSRPKPPSTTVVRYGNTERIVPSNGLGDDARTLVAILNASKQ